MIDIETASVHQLRAAVRSVLELCDSVLSYEEESDEDVEYSNAYRAVSAAVASALAGDELQAEVNRLRAELAEANEEVKAHQRIVLANRAVVDAAVAWEPEWRREFAGSDPDPFEAALLDAVAAYRSSAAGEEQS